MAIFSWRHLLLFVAVLGSTASALPKQPSTSLASLGGDDDDVITRMVYKLSPTTADGCIINELNDDQLLVSQRSGHGSSSRSLTLESASDHELEHLMTADALRGGAKAAVAPSSASSSSNSALLQRLKVGVYFGVWYALNVIYNSKYLFFVFSLQYISCVPCHLSLRGLFRLLCLPSMK